MTNQHGEVENLLHYRQPAPLSTPIILAVPPRSRPIRRDLLILVALCAILYGVGLTSHGLTNWQEAQRALVAREMQGRGHWLIPTINDHPYLAKPPLFYWVQVAIADLLGRRIGEFELRLTVALAGRSTCGPLTDKTSVIVPLARLRGSVPRAPRPDPQGSRYVGLAGCASRAPAPIRATPSPPHLPT